MGWIIEIAKLLPVCTGTALVLAVAMMVFPVGNAKATGVNLLFALTGSRLALVGVLNVVIGLVLSRLTVVGDAARRWHFGLR
jgi:uncharacterized integral membrane protein